MATFFFSYRAPKGYTMGRPETMAPLGDLGDDTKLGGYSIVTADDLEAALALARGCPILRESGGVEVGVLASIPGDSGASA
jgi:hypothetical protein